MEKARASEVVGKCLRFMEVDPDASKRGGLEMRSNRPRFRYPELLRFALVELLGLPCEWEPFDKVRWRIDALYRGHPVCFEDRKMGFYVGMPASMDADTEQELIKRLLGATTIAARHIRTLAAPQISAGNFSLVNDYYAQDNAYRYFRERAIKAYASEPPEPVITRNEGVVMREHDIGRPEREGEFNFVAMVNEYFSRLEHLMILVLPAKQAFSPGAGALKELMGAGWKDKFQAVFDLNQEPDAHGLFTRLVDLKEAVRNPRAHGGFLKQGGSAWFHVEEVGALPMDLLDQRFHGYLPDTDLHSFENVCSLFDEIDEFLRLHESVQYGMIAVESYFDPAFDADSLSRYRAAIADSQNSGGTKPFQDYIDGCMRRIDAQNNYEF